MKIFTTLAALLLLAFTVQAQMADSIKVQFVRDWQRAKAYTKEYLDAMPKDKYNYRAHDSIRTCVELCPGSAT